MTDNLNARVSLSSACPKNASQGKTQNDPVTRFEQNDVLLSGTLEEDVSPYRTPFGGNMLHSVLLVRRRSGTVDRVPLLIDQEIASSSDAPLRASTRIRLFGQIRTYYDRTGHLHVYVFPIVLSSFSGKEDLNHIRLSGQISRKPSYNVTPLGREITNLVLAVPTSWKEWRGVSYIPAIFWGSMAGMVLPFEPSEIVSVTGRFQSREYEKLLPNAILPERRIAFEISCHHFTALERDLHNGQNIFW